MKVSIYGENYEVGCARGDEEKVLQLANMVSKHFVEPLVKQFDAKRISREHLLALAAIKLADALSEARRQAEAQSKMESSTPVLKGDALSQIECRFDRLERLLAQMQAQEERTT